MSDIVERLREVAERADANYPVIMQQAADTITALRSENERLLAANKDSMLHFDVLKADYEKLRAALRDIATGQVTYLPFIQTVARAALEGKP